MAGRQRVDPLAGGPGEKRLEVAPVRTHGIGGRVEASSRDRRGTPRGRAAGAPPDLPIARHRAPPPPPRRAPPPRARSRRTRAPRSSSAQARIGRIAVALCHLPRALEGRDQPEVHVHRLVVDRLGRGRVGDERPQRGRRGEGGNRPVGQVGPGVDGGQKARGYGLGVALGPGDLAGEAHAAVRAQGEGGVERAGGVDERVAVHDAVAEELGMLQAGNHPEDAALLRAR